MSKKILPKEKGMDYLHNLLVLFQEILIKTLQVNVYIMLVDKPEKRMEVNQRLQQKVGP